MDGLILCIDRIDDDESAPPVSQTAAMVFEIVKLFGVLVSVRTMVMGLMT
jgi:hypothetical protein